MKEFSNEDLKAGMFVELRNGYKGVLIPCYYTITENTIGLSVVSGDKASSRICEASIYCGLDFNSDFDIIKVYDLNKGNSVSLFSTENRDLLWEYKEPKEMTIAEIEAELGYKIKIVDNKEK